MKIKWDYHNHTKYSYCSKDDQDLFTYAVDLHSKGFTHIGITDHYHYDLKLGHEAIDSHKRHLDNIRKNHRELDDINIYVSMELDMVAPGQLSAPNEIIDRLDYVSCACTHSHIHTTTNPLVYEYPVIAQYAYDYLISGATHKVVDVIVHPFDTRGMDKYIKGYDLRQVTKLIGYDHLMKVVELLIYNDTALELSSMLRNPIYAEAVYQLLYLSKKNGVKFAFGSDSHAIKSNGSVRDIQNIVDELGVSIDDIWFPSLVI